MKRVIAGAAIAVSVVLGVAACGSNAGEPDDAKGRFRVAEVNVNGKELTCVTWKHGYGGGSSCNWEAYNSK